MFILQNVHFTQCSHKGTDFKIHKYYHITFLMHNKAYKTLCIRSSNVFDKTFYHYRQKSETQKNMDSFQKKKNFKTYNFSILN